MSVQEINGVLVSFPFTPYGCQVEYMKKVLTCLQQSQNGVLESPTGTGKTLSLLCSSLAWLEGRKAQVELNKQMGVMQAASELQNTAPTTLSQLAAGLNTSAGTSWGSDDFLVPKIIYASRTHSQLSQAVQELKKTAYKSVKTSVFGSREQLCIHPHVQKATSNSAKVQMCRQLVKNRRCHYYNNVEDLKNKSEPRKAVGNIVDIEDLVQMGQKSKTCPYYMARELKADADIVFMPYNYLLDTVSRKVHGVDLQGSVIIFDEAHNLEKICEESASFDLSSLDIATAIEETTKLGEKLLENSSEMEMSQSEDGAIVPEFELVDVIRLKKTLLEIEAKIEAIEIPKEKGKTLAGSFIFQLLKEVNINWSNKNAVLDVLDKMATYLSQDESNAVLNTKGAGLSKFASALKIIFCQEPREMMSLTTHEESLAKQFKVHVHMKDNSFKKPKKVDSWSTNEKKDEKILSYWCFSPGHTMKDLLSHGVKVIILTSGTLSPLESFAKEMEIPFPVQLENSHVIEESQVWLGTICKGPDAYPLISDFKNRSKSEYQASLGNTIINFARVIPDGLLVFFPSYPVMEKCIEVWQEGNQWTRMNQYKPVVVEPKGKTAFEEAMTEFYDKINDSTLNGAIFMAVCRGKVSEGLDFADNNGRAVLITGLPFPPIFDPRIQLKMEYMNQNKGEKQMDGWAWYRLQATRAVNQAIGRVIRHKQDYGAILLLDNRFASSQSQNSLPKWVRENSKQYNQFGPALRDVIKFFKVTQTLYPMSASRSNAKKQRKEEGGVVSGDFFEPTVTRKSHGQSSILAGSASAVACHVPGLGPNQEDSIFAQYKDAENCGKGKKRSLLEALDSSETVDSTKADESFTSSGLSSFQPPKKKTSVKKKIIVTPNSSTMSCENQRPKGKPDNLSAPAWEKCKQYVAQVKSILSKESYARFSSTLTSYRRNYDIHASVTVLADLFTQSEDKYHLFQRFYQYVRREDKPHFRQVCLDLTGLACETSTKDEAPDTNDKPSQVVEISSTQNNATVAHQNSPPLQASASSGVGCVVCGKDPKESGVYHECQALACVQCWKKLFEKENHSCPHCKAKVKKKSLSKKKPEIAATSQ